MSVRVMLVRGVRRVVRVVGPSSSSSSLRVVGRLVELSLLDVVSDDDVGDVEGPSMSVVSGGLVLVIVCVVVVSVEGDAVAENDGVTKSRGASSVSPNWRAMAVAATINMPITTIASTLAPRTVEVRLCQGCPSSSSNCRRATALIVVATCR